MRPFLFGNEMLKQHRFIELGCNLHDVAMFEHIYQGALSGRLVYITTYEYDEDGNKLKTFYYYLTYNKLKEDMPILNWEERTIRKCITKLENVGLLKRYKFTEKVVNSRNQIIMPNARMLYVAVTPGPLYDSPTSSVLGRDFSLKNFVVNRDINQSYEPKITYKDNELVYFNPGMQLSRLNILGSNVEIAIKLKSLVLKNLQVQLTKLSFSYFEHCTLKLLNNSSIKIEFFKEETVKSIIEKEVFKIEQAIVDAYKQIYTEMVVLENKLV